MDKEQRNSLIQGISFIIGIPILALGAILAYWLISVPRGDAVVNEIDEPFSIGETWIQDELFSLTFNDVHEMKWEDVGVDENSGLANKEMNAYQKNGYEVYDLCFSITNLNYQGFTDVYRPNAPFVKGLFFWANVEGKDGEVLAVNEYKKYPDKPLMINESAKDIHCLIMVAPTVKKIVIEFAANKETTEKSDERRMPREIYKQAFQVCL